MSFLDRLRDLLSGPPRIADGGDPEAAADLHEEYGTPDPGEAEIKRMAETGQVLSAEEAVRGLGSEGSFGALEAAETAEADLETEEAPPDPSP